MNPSSLQLSKAATTSTPMLLSSTLRSSFSSSFLHFQRHRGYLLFASSSRFLVSPPNPPPPPRSRLPRNRKPDANGIALTALSQDTGRVVPIELHEEMTGSYITYSMSVLLGRALPDVRDGLKPVHRRILYDSDPVFDHLLVGLLYWFVC